MKWLIVLAVLALTVDAQQGLLYKPKPKCVKDGNAYHIGESFDDPHDECRVCTCCENGRFKCKKKDCVDVPPPCGLDHQQATNETCCPVCSDLCKTTTCDEISCPGVNAELYYPADSCCQRCGCRFRGVLVPEGPINTPPTAACEGCTCTAGTVTCTNEAPCPVDKLKCVNPKVQDFTNNCTWICPDGPTCFRGDTVIKPGEYKVVDEKLCFCYTDWYPEALCGNFHHWGGLEQSLYDNMCMKKPIDYKLW